MCIADKGRTKGVSRALSGQRASIASANYEENIELFGIKVADGPLTSRLQYLKAGDPIPVSREPVGTLLIDDLLPGKRLYSLAAGRRLAPFLSIVKDPET